MNHILHFLYILHILILNVCHVKENSTAWDFKEIPLIGQGFQAFIDNLFWYLPFSSKTQADDMRDKKDMSDDNWVTKSEELDWAGAQ